MRFNLEILLDIEGSRHFSRGVFTARRAVDIPEVAYRHIKSIVRDTGYRPTLIVKVVVNGMEDITDLVQEIENRPLGELGDVFW